MCSITGCWSAPRARSIFLAAAIALLQLWGLGTLDWLAATQLGQRVLSSLVTLSVTVLLALAVWEAVNAAIERHLAKLTRDAQVARSARLRTLLPLLRTTLSAHDPDRRRHDGVVRDRR